MPYTYGFSLDHKIVCSTDISKIILNYTKSSTKSAIVRVNAVNRASPWFVLRRLTGLSNREIGRYVGMRPSAVSRAGIMIERQLEKDKSLKRVVDKIVWKVEG